jgi:hypothetical protein
MFDIALHRAVDSSAGGAAHGPHGHGVRADAGGTPTARGPRPGRGTGTGLPASGSGGRLAALQGEEQQPPARSPLAGRPRGRGTPAAGDAGTHPRAPSGDGAASLARADSGSSLSGAPKGTPPAVRHARQSSGGGGGGGSRPASPAPPAADPFQLADLDFPSLAGRQGSAAGRGAAGR